MDCRLASGEVAVERPAVGRDLVPLHGDDRVDLPGGRVVDRAPLIVLEHAERHVVAGNRKQVLIIQVIPIIRSCSWSVL